jgi:hypothetical protein
LHVLPEALDERHQLALEGVVRKYQRSPPSSSSWLPA